MGKALQGQQPRELWGGVSELPFVGSFAVGFYSALKLDNDFQ